MYHVHICEDEIERHIHGYRQINVLTDFLRESITNIGDLR